MSKRYAGRYNTNEKLSGIDLVSKKKNNDEEKGAEFEDLDADDVLIRTAEARRRRSKRSLSSSVRELPQSKASKYMCDESEDEHEDEHDSEVYGHGQDDGVDNDVDKDVNDGRSDSKVDSKDDSEDDSEDGSLPKAKRDTKSKLSAKPKIVWTRPDCGGTDVASTHTSGTTEGSVCDGLTCLIAVGKKVKLCACSPAPTRNFTADMKLLQAIERVATPPGHVGWTKLYPMITSEFNILVGPTVRTFGSQTLQSEVVRLVALHKTYTADNPFGNYLHKVIDAVEAKTTKQVKSSGKNHDTKLVRSLQNDRLATSTLDGVGNGASSSSYLSSSSSSSISSRAQTNHDEDIMSAVCRMLAPANVPMADTGVANVDSRAAELQVCVDNAEASVKRAMDFLRVMGKECPEAVTSYTVANKKVEDCQDALAEHLKRMK